MTVVSVSTRLEENTPLWRYMSLDKLVNLLFTNECMRTAKHTGDLVRRGSLEVCGIVSCGPCDRREIGDELDGHVCQSGQDLMKVFADRDAKPAAALDHGEDRGPTRSGLFAADVDPVFSAQRYAAHGVFRQVVAKFQFRIFEEAGQFLP